MDKTIDDILAKGKSTLETVRAVRWWTDSLFSFTVTRPEGFAFTAGQYARLGLPDEHGAIWRAYSMTSAPAADALEFYSIVVPGGLFTTKLRQLQPGDRILLDKQVFGFMTVDRFEGGEDFWMLSTGTGIGPFLSILRDPLAWQKFHRLILVHCVRHAAEFAYIEELEALRSQGPDRLRIIRTVTREEPGSDMLRGRITTLLANGTLEQTAGTALSEAQSRIMLCGNPEMIEETRKLLHLRGLRPCRRAQPGQFVTENYW